MPGLLVDSSVILDVFEDDLQWAEWSEAKLNEYSLTHVLYINSVVYAEISIGFARIEELDAAVQAGGFVLMPIPKEALFLAGKAFLAYKKRKGQKKTPLPDFFIGAQAAVQEMELLTRDPSRVKAYYPSVKMISP